MLGENFLFTIIFFTLFFFEVKILRKFFFLLLLSQAESKKKCEATELTWNDSTKRTVCVFAQKKNIKMISSPLFFTSFSSPINCYRTNNVELWAFKISFFYSTKKNLVRSTQKLNLTVYNHNLLLHSISFLLLGIIALKLPSFFFCEFEFKSWNDLHLLTCELYRASCNLINSYANGISHFTWCF